MTHREIAEQVYDQWLSVGDCPGPYDDGPIEYRGAQILCGEYHARPTIHGAFWCWGQVGINHRLITAVTRSPLRKHRVQRIISVLHWLDDWAGKQTLKALAELGA